MPTDGAESVNTPRRGSNGREWKQITGSEGRRNSHQTPRRNQRCLHDQEKREANNAGPSISRAPVSEYTSRVIAVSGRRGSAGLRGSGRGLTRWMLPLSQQRITKEHRPFLQTPPCWHSQSFFQQIQISQHSLAPTLWESADRIREGAEGGFQHKLCSVKWTRTNESPFMTWGLIECLPREPNPSSFLLK